MQNAPLQATVTFNPLTAYGGALPALANDPAWASQPDLEKAVDLVQRIRRVDPTFAKQPTPQQLDYVQATVLPAVNAIKAPSIGEQFGEGIEKVLNPTDYAPPRTPNSPAYAAGNLLGNVGGSIAASIAGASVGAAAGAPVGGVGAIPGGIGGGILGAGLFASGQRPAQVRREANLAFQPRDRGKETEEALKGAAIDFAAAGISEAIPVAQQPVRKILAGTGAGSLLGGATNAADQYIQTGRVDPGQVGASALFSGVTGGALPTAQVLLPATRNALRAYANQTVVRNGRRAQRGFVGVPPEAPDGTHYRQYNGQLTDESPLDNLDVQKLVGDARQEVNEYVSRGDMTGLNQAIEQYRAQGNQSRIQALYIAMTTTPGLPDDFVTTALGRSRAYRSETARSLRVTQEDPYYKARIDLLKSVKRGAKLKGERQVNGKQLNKDIKDAEEQLKGLYGDLFRMAVRLFGHAVDIDRPRRTGSPRRAAREVSEKARAERKAPRKAPDRGDKTKKLLARALVEDVNQPRKAKKDPTIDMSPDEKRVYEFAKKRLRDRKWLAAQLKYKQYKEPTPGITLAERALTEAERELFKQKPPELKLRLKRVSDKPPKKGGKAARVDQAKRKRKRDVRETEDLEQRHQRLLKLANAHVNRLDRTINPQLKLKLNTQKMLSRELQEAIALLGPERQQQYRELLAIQAREVIERKYRERPKQSRNVKTMLEKLVELQKDKVLDPEHVRYALRDIADTHALKSQDFATLNTLVERTAEPGLSAAEVRRREADLQKFLYERKIVGFLPKYLGLRYAGMLIQVATQLRNYGDGLAYGMFRTGIVTPGRALLDTAASKITGKRSYAVKVQKIDHEMFERHEITGGDEVSNILYDLKNDTNTSNTLAGQVLGDNGLKRGILPKQIDQKVQTIARAIQTTGDRLIFALAYEQAMLSELAAYRMTEGVHPRYDSPEYKILKARALNEAAQTNFTNRGWAEYTLNKVQQGASYLADATGRGLGLLDEDDSYELGRNLVPFTTIVGNTATRPIEMLPGLGAFGIYMNRAFQANVTKVPLDHQATITHIITMQALGAAIGAGGIGLGADLLYKLGYHHTYIPGEPKNQSRSARDLHEHVGVGPNRFNMTAFYRFLASRNENDLEPQTGDTYLSSQGYNTIDSILRTGTATGVQDRQQRLEADSKRHGVADTLATSLKAWVEKNEALSGVNRPVQQFSTGTNPDTGEFDPAIGAAKVAADSLGFKLPLQDTIPGPQRDPRTAAEILLNSNPLTAQFVPERVGIDGAPKMKNPGYPTRFEGPETVEGKLYELEQATGSQKHLIGTVRATIEDDEGVKTRIPEGQRRDAQALLNESYLALVSEVIEKPGFQQLDAKQQVTVLAKIKNDVTKALMADLFGQKITDITYQNGQVNRKLTEQLGAKSLLRGNMGAYAREVFKYIKNARKNSRDQERTQMVRQKYRQNNPVGYKRITTGAKR